VCKPAILAVVRIAAFGNGNDLVYFGRLRQAVRKLNVNGLEADAASVFLAQHSLT
jgi:hypothetical protein